MQLEWTIQLARRYRNELGAVHCGRLQSIAAEKHGWLRIGSHNGEPVAMIAGRQLTKCDARLAYIVAAAVPLDARRRKFAETLVEDFIDQAAHNARTIVQATCRCDIEANEFWFGSGFTPCFARYTGSTRGHPTIVWRRHVNGLQDDLLHYVHPLRARLSGGRYARTKASSDQFTLWAEVDPETRTIAQVTSNPDDLLELLDMSPLSAAHKEEAVKRRLAAHNASETTRA
jgi:hypothetical protein